MRFTPRALAPRALALFITWSLTSCFVDDVIEDGAGPIGGSDVGGGGGVGGAGGSPAGTGGLGGAGASGGAGAGAGAGGAGPGGAGGQGTFDCVLDFDGTQHAFESMAVLVDQDQLTVKVAGSLVPEDVPTGDPSVEMFIVGIDDWFDVTVRRAPGGGADATNLVFQAWVKNCLISLNSISAQLDEPYAFSLDFSFDRSGDLMSFSGLEGGSHTSTVALCVAPSFVSGPLLVGGPPPVWASSAFIGTLESFSLALSSSACVDMILDDVSDPNANMLPSSPSCDAVVVPDVGTPERPKLVCAPN